MMPIGAGSHGNRRPPLGEAGGAQAWPEGAETEALAELDGWPRPESLPFGELRFSFRGSVHRRRGRHLEFLQTPNFPVNHEESREETRSGDNSTSRLFQPGIAPAGMGDKIWLPFPVLLLAALPPVLLPGAAGFTPSLDSDFTFTLPAGQKECFYQPMPLKASLEIEYQVLDGAGLDIDFHLASPEGKTLVFEQRKSDGVHTCIRTKNGPGVVVHAYNPSTLEAEVGGSRSQEIETILANMVKPCLY
ncbi:transmembrane emp24 domain-containing protein 5 isoform X2 [Hylobates moloch]|uniref:transmembrane emp24 domain-containing protein 5 isoform X2 n=1 Tax=Hylobates moloch TaxID=81572 RepID=UPI0026749CAF|nr:transmembrane emp24 domain-containing protein 5 isoform X2 [Hylobates moloch]